MSKNILCALALVGLAGSVQALPTPLGAIGLSGGSLFAPLPDSGPFSDQYSFTLGTGNGVKIGFTSIFLGSPRADIPGLSFSILGLGSVAASPSVVDGVLSADVSFGGLNVGQSYTLVVAGDQSAYLGTDYLLQYAADKISNPSAYNVAEPDSIAMVLGALGLMGLMARRRQAVKGESK